MVFVPLAVLDPRALPLVPVKSICPSNVPALKLPAFADRFRPSVKPFGPVSVRLPDTVPLIVDADFVLVFSTLIALVIEPSCVMSIDVSWPSDGSN
jgi:hypothetical protein